MSDSMIKAPRGAVLLLGIVTAAALAAAVIRYVQAAPTSVEARLQALEDREAIRSLLIEYGRTLDQKDFAAFAALFAKTEGEWIGGLGSAKGQTAIRELMESTIGSNTTGAPPTSFHVLANENIELNGDHASSVTKWVFVRQSPERKPEWVYLGHYDDTFVREGGEWRFLRREAFTDIPVPTGQ
jgi:3-phenylpropionate/cinnamic acid dioxygenase small subunit